MKYKAPFFIVLLVVFIHGHYMFGQVYARNGMVASSSKIASQVGVDILKKGGNAIDASIATAFALAVTHPSAGNIGGGGFLVFMNTSGTTTTIDFREKAPIKASPNMFLDDAGNLAKGMNLYGMESNVNHIGAKSVGVPGTVAGLYLAHQKYGSLPWENLIQPAIDIAENGFPLTWDLFNAATFFETNSPVPFLKNYFKNANGEPTQFGELWKQPELANTLTEIRDHGQDGFYKGVVAKEIVRFIKENGGLITLKDLERYTAIERKPIKGNFKGYDIYSMPPPSSGGVALIEMMNLMELANLDSIEFNSAAYVHLIAEAMRRAFADRAEHLGDSDFNLDTPLDKLTSKSFAKTRFENIDMTKASISDTTKFGQMYDGSSTTHFSVMDKEGNAVSLTYTLEHSYGSGMGAKKLGFIFNNEMGDFNPQPGFTTSSGQIGTDPNLIQPEKRMLSSMTPTIVAKDGKPYLIIGSPGGRTIINTVFQTVLNVLAYDMQVDKAIEAMKIHHQWLPDQIEYERTLLSPDTRKALEDMNHTLVPVNSLGSLMGIQLDAKNNIMIGASDSSSPDGAAIGY
ncbi:gamma-glutamyltranspeptidase [Sediminicola sp. YIK13]|uniref:gamma-glutamyltransferase n=1 Tax=Sediminicola sp. YIK13 TaxID=1453352 RepID=UPI0007211194|nr:gamma-glutamyltransferase [Sediminicola sp. YIK13]ALM06607.1 gamma-glutamyltranspeptidase [Sediminicola sp. YIK13]